MVVLRPVNLRWINDAQDDTADFCAHGDIEFRIDGDLLLDETNGRNLTVSAAALYLLRSLSVPHTRLAPVGDHLFPCCGFTLYDVPEEPDVVICGCPNGEDVEIHHQADGRGVIIKAGDGREWAVEWSEWRATVCAFADRVSDFYAACSPKCVRTEDAAGFAKFVSEWERRRGAPFGQTNHHT
ncbi:MAG: hypothetical protein FJ304_17075 [Planctomycetes bacterium]|nr:hypothetical protein [Planctomycetota bacterium]